MVIWVFKLPIKKECTYHYGPVGLGDEVHDPRFGEFSQHGGQNENEQQNFVMFCPIDESTPQRDSKHRETVLYGVA